MAKKQLFVLIPGKACPIGFNELLIYSFLVYRFKAAKENQKAGAVTRQQIYRGTGLSATRTIPNAIEELQKFELAGVNEVGRIFPWKSKHDDWFVNMKSPGLRPWHSRLAYFPIWVPSSAAASGLVPRINALYFFIRQRPLQKQVYYALKLGISESTVRSAIKKLRDLKLLLPDKIKPTELTQDQLTFWQDRSQKKITSWQLSKTAPFNTLRVVSRGFYHHFQERDDSNRCANPEQVFNRFVDAIGNKMLERGYSKHQVLEYWKWTINSFLRDSHLVEANTFQIFLRYSFLKLFEYVEKTTLNSFANGKFSGTNSEGLLRYFTQSVCNAMEVAWQNWPAENTLTFYYEWNPPH